MSDIDFKKIATTACEDLLTIKASSFPVSFKNLKAKQGRLEIISLQTYSFITGVPICDLTACEFSDGYMIKNVRPNLHLILYDENTKEYRANHTVWHEIGHFRLGHRTHGEKEEIEAHFYAAQIRVPTPLVIELQRRGYTISKDFISSAFNIGAEAAEKKMDYFRRFPRGHRNKYDDLILCLFSKWLNSKYPEIRRVSENGYYDQMETERLLWQ